MGFFAKDDKDVLRRGKSPDDMRNLRFKHKADAWIFRSVGKTNFLLDILNTWLKMAKWPGSVVWHPLLKPKNNHWYNLPVNVEVRKPHKDERAVGKPGLDRGLSSVVHERMDLDLEAEAMPMTEAAVRKLIDEAAYIHILDRCLCRHGRDCKEHRHDLGCMFLGASGCDVTPEFSHPATKQEAYNHLRAGIEDGLMPMGGRIRVDNWAFILPDHHALMGICLCCDCCCFMSFYRHVPATLMDEIYLKMPGTCLMVDSGVCIGCGQCAKHCYLDAIRIVDGKSITSDVCRACGRCVNRCSQGARHLVGSDPDYAQKTAVDLLAHADIACGPNDRARV